MAQPVQTDESFEVECPHCHKPFQGKLLQGQTGRHTGFKCPHCNLFVAYERTDGTSP
jgi:endogenous inhibitor of DNA gyrase (YacG/DUF329 family)